MIALNDFKLPIKISNDSDYADDLFLKFDTYIETVKKVFIKDTALINNVTENVELIKKSINFYYDANISEAKTLLKNVLEKYMNNEFIISSLDSSQGVRGITRNTLESNDPEFEDSINQEEIKKIAYSELFFFKARIGNEEFKKNDFLHIPFNKRGLIATQRFSIAGVPCMYFGLSSYVCWLELGRPLDGEFNVASYKVDPNIKVLNLAITQAHINGFSNDLKNLDLVKSLIEIFPLVMATSYKVFEKNRKFQSEYLISQLLMQCLSELKLDGIIYISKRINQDFEGIPYFVNLAVPMKNDNKIYSNFARNLEFTKPINFAEFKNVYNPEYVSSSQDKTPFCDHWESVDLKYMNNPIDYKNLTFSKLEKFLVNEIHEKLKI